MHNQDARPTFTGSNLLSLSIANTLLEFEFVPIAL